MTDDIERLTRERDEARIELCMAVAVHDCDNKVMTSPQQIAEEYGWGYLIPLMENE